MGSNTASSGSMAQTAPEHSLAPTAPDRPPPMSARWGQATAAHKVAIKIYEDAEERLHTYRRTCDEAEQDMLLALQDRNDTEAAVRALLPMPLGKVQRSPQRTGRPKHDLAPPAEPGTVALSTVPVSSETEAEEEEASPAYHTQAKEEVKEEQAETGRHRKRRLQMSGLH